MVQPSRQGAPAICPSPWRPPRSSSRTPPPPKILKIHPGIHPLGNFDNFDIVFFNAFESSYHADGVCMCIYI